MIADYQSKIVYAPAVKALALERVQTGMAWLDEHVPHWYEVGYIVLGKTLNLMDGQTCVLGQLAKNDLEAWFGPLTRRGGHEYSYLDVSRYLLNNDLIPETGGAHVSERGAAWMCEHGFLLDIEPGRPTDSTHISYGLLTETWRRAITQRRRRRQHALAKS